MFLALCTFRPSLALALDISNSPSTHFDAPAIEACARLTCACVRTSSCSLSRRRIWSSSRSSRPALFADGLSTNSKASVEASTSLPPLISSFQCCKFDSHLSRVPAPTRSTQACLPNGALSLSRSSLSVVISSLSDEDGCLACGPMNSVCLCASAAHCHLPSSSSSPLLKSHFAFRSLHFLLSSSAEGRGDPK